MAQRDLVLVGGGHSQAIALLKLAQQPRSQVKLTLISYPPLTPYSGMLPAYLAGFYSLAQTHIDLRALARLVRAEFIPDRVLGLDPEKKLVFCEHHPPVSFDYLSLDIGSTPAQSQIQGASTYAIAAKPVATFLQAWETILTQARTSPQQPLALAIVGGGAGGVELTLTMQARLETILAAPLTLHLFHQGSHLLTPHSTPKSEYLKHLLQRRGVHLHLGEKVTAILPQGVSSYSQTVGVDYTILVTQAAASPRLAQAGLSTDAQGFVFVADTLQTLSHPYIFASGDMASQKNHPRPKAGVFAVRMGKPLGENLVRILENKPLVTYIPQKRYLSLINTGQKTAIATWGDWAWESAWFWYAKDYLDRAFMRQFSKLPEENP